MNTNTKTFFIALCMLVVGFAIGALVMKQPTVHDDINMDHSMSMADSMASMTASLAGKTGDAFDQTFIEEMIVHHQGAVDMAKFALMHAKHQEIKTLASAIIAAQTSEITQMQSWLAQWYGK